MTLRIDLSGSSWSPAYPSTPDPRTVRRPCLLQLLLHVPALERSNALFASAVAYAYLVASGLKIAASPDQVRDLARLVKDGRADVRAIADELRSWSLL